MEYLIFTLPLWTLIYLWGVPVLLMGGSAEKQTLAQRAKSFVNPMFVGMLLGVLIGLTNIPVPQFIRSAVSAAGSCMSPVAMLLTGMTIAQFNLREILNIKGVYLVTALRLLVFPLLFLGAMLVFSNAGNLFHLRNLLPFHALGTKRHHCPRRFRAGYQGGIRYGAGFPHSFLPDDPRNFYAF